MKNPTKLVLPCDAYLEDGRKVRVETYADNAYYVLPYIDGDRYDYETGESYEYIDWPLNHHYLKVSDVFSAPPMEHYHHEIAKARTELATLEEQSQAARQEIQRLKDESKSVQSDLHHYPALQAALDVVQGKMQWGIDRHNVTYFKAVPIQELLKEKDSWADRFRLLSVVPSAGNFGKLNLKLNTYSDGSGRDDDVVLFETEEQAQEWIREELSRLAMEWLNKPMVGEMHYKAQSGRRIVDAATHWGAPIDKRMETIVSDYELSERQQKIASHQAEIAKLKAGE